MKSAVLGPNQSVSFSATCHTVTPRSSALSSGQRRIAPPKSSRRRPRCAAYHAASALWSLLVLKNTPPMPVTRATAPSFYLHHLPLERAAATEFPAVPPLPPRSPRATVYR